MSISSGDHRDWANLPRDLLASIAGRLYVPEFVQFGAVCTSWLSAAAPPNSGGAGPLSPRMPYLLTAGKEGENSDRCVLFNLADGRAQPLYPLPELRGKWFVGSQDGWLALLDEFANVSLFNPFTRSQIHLPPITTLPFVEPVYNDADGSSISSYLFHEENLWPACKEPVEIPVEEFRMFSIGIRKVILSSSPTTRDNAPTVVAIIHFTKLIIFARPGEKMWNFLDERDGFDDVIYHDGKFLAIGESHGEVFALDFNCNPPGKSTYAEGFGEHRNYSARYLVDSGGELLQVCRDSLLVEEKNMFVVQDFLIMRLDPKKFTWCPLKSLGDRSLFLGNCYSISLSAHEIPGLRCNHIYFTDDGWDCFTDEVSEMVRDVGFYSIENGTVKLCDHPELQLRWPPPVWITPVPQKHWRRS